MSHTESLLLVNHKQTQVLEFHILRQQPVSTNDNINHSLLHILNGLSVLGCSPESRQHPDPYREVLHSVCEGIIVLSSQYCCRYQHRYLLTVSHRLKCRSKCYLRLTVSDIAAD